MSDTNTHTWGHFKRKGLSEMRPYTEGEDLSNVSISTADEDAGSPKIGDMIARNPANHDDQWLVAAKYFAENLEPAEQSTTGSGSVAPLPMNNGDWKEIDDYTDVYEIPRVGCIVDRYNGTVFVPGVKLCEGKIVAIN